MSDTPPAAVPVLTRTFFLTWGVQFVAYTLDIALWGIAFVLVLQYFRTYGQRDPPLQKTVVGILGFFSTVHSIFLAKMNYADYVTLFGNLDAQNVILYEANVMLGCVFIVSFTAQMFYASRISICETLVFVDYLPWQVTRHDWRFVAPVVILGFIQFGGGLGQTILVAKVHLYSDLQARTYPVSSTQAGASLLCDVTITAILFYVLRKSRTGIRRTDSTLDKLGIYALNRGAMTSVWALCHLILFVGMPGTFVFMLFIVPSAHLYVISVCSMLISRESLHNDTRIHDDFIETLNFGPVNSGNMGAHYSLSDPTRTQADVQVHPPNAVHVTTSVIKWVDEVGPTEIRTSGEDKMTLNSSTACAV
ncbi:hypothetical protein FB45DRAFT_910928 [Roridomyces roridus]|uniref:DUF6534 domain-containing protein n=1 Tax=Roridomyces roridus TaxID=1738132 RepID=A0AAD7BZY6_9AGAR|nr:hypothetical protein FB45DRAFT_910928 [Roridomyces roridus]